MDNLIAWVAGILSIISVAVSLYFGIRKHPFDLRKLGTEVDKDQVELAKMYKAMATDEAETTLQLRAEIQQIRVSLEAIKNRHEKELEEIRNALLLAEERADKFADWAHRLVNQVKSLGEIPVPFEVTKARKGNTVPRQPTEPQ